MPTQLNLVHDYPCHIDALWGDIVRYDSLADSMAGAISYDGLPEGEAEEGQSFSLQLKRWNWLPMGKWTIRVQKRDDAARILESVEHGGPIRRFEHRIELTPLGTGLTRYTDTLTISAAGLSSLFAPQIKALYKARHLSRAERLLPTDIKLRPIGRSDLAEASSLCLHSKAHWGYNDTLLSLMMGELTLTHAQMTTDAMQLAERNGEICGVAQVTPGDPGCALDKLFVVPSAIGSGVGRILYAWALNAARDFGARELTVDSDPNAAGFYDQMGATPAGSVPSGSIPERSLPHFIHTV